MNQFILAALALCTMVHGEETPKQRITEKIQERGNLPYITVSKQLELLDLLSEFDLGKSFIEVGVLTGPWTDYIVTNPINPHVPKNYVEDFILNRAPVALATQQRFQIFNQEIQKRLVNGGSYASIPSGIMSSLLNQDFSSLSHFSLTGIDLDSKSLKEANHRARKKGIGHVCRFFSQDAWTLDIHDEFDLIESNGLTLYQPDDAKVVELYTLFFHALKPGGCLITSFLTPPPMAGHVNEWDLKEINSQDALQQKILFGDVLGMKWQNYRSETLVRAQLFEAGFVDIEVIYDHAHLFPTIIGKKPN